MLTENKRKTLATRVYLAVWRWHFWMGLLISPILLVVAVTGAIYVFKPQIEPHLYPGLFFVDPAGQKQGSFDDFEAAVAREMPGFRLAYINLYPDSRRSWEGFARKEGADGSIENHRVFYNPYQADFLGGQDYNHTFFRVVLSIHRRLMADLPGRLIVETTTCWAIISVLTGLYLWWSKKGGKITGFLIPRISGGKRAVLRDWHAIPGVWLSIFLILIMVTGLLFTRIWGTAYLSINALTGGFPEFYTNPPHSTVPDDHQPERISLDQAYETALARYDFSKQPHGIEIPQPGSDHAIEVLTDITRPWLGLGAIFIDAYSGRELLFQTGESLPWRTHLTLYFYPVHTGIVGGVPTQILAVFACLILVALVATGMVLWWSRRPPGKLAAPRKPPPKSIPGWIVWLTVVLAVFLPTVGLTLLLIYGAGWVTRLFRRKAAPIHA